MQNKIGKKPCYLFNSTLFLRKFSSTGASSFLINIVLAKKKY